MSGQQNVSADFDSANTVSKWNGIGSKTLKMNGGPAGDAEVVYQKSKARAKAQSSQKYSAQCLREMSPETRKRLQNRIYSHAQHEGEEAKRAHTGNSIVSLKVEQSSVIKAINSLDRATAAEEKRIKEIQRKHK